MMVVLGAFGAGLLASLSPCVYPLLPISVGFLGAGSREGRKGRVLGYVLGQVVAFVALGALAVTLGENLGFSAEIPWVNRAVAAVLIASSVVAWQGAFPSWLRLPRWVGRGGSTSAGVSRPLRWGGAALVGAGSALVASPCTTPILGGVLALMAASSSMARGLGLMVAYSLGFSTLFLVMGLGLARLPRSGSWLLAFHRVSAAALFTVGVFYAVRSFG